MRSSSIHVKRVVLEMDWFTSLVFAFQEANLAASGTDPRLVQSASSANSSELCCRATAAEAFSCSSTVGSRGRFGALGGRTASMVVTVGPCDGRVQTARWRKR